MVQGNLPIPSAESVCELADHSLAFTHDQQIIDMHRDSALHPLFAQSIEYTDVPLISCVS